jgi:hypothetical protein
MSPTFAIANLLVELILRELQDCFIELGNILVIGQGVPNEKENSQQHEWFQKQLFGLDHAAKRYRTATKKFSVSAVVIFAEIMAFRKQEIDAGNGSLKRSAPSSCQPGRGPISWHPPGTRIADRAPL